MKPKKPLSRSRRRFLKTLAVGAVAGIAAPTYAHEIEPEHLVLTQRDVVLPDWPAHANGLRVGHLSDFHCDTARAAARTARAAKMLMDQKPDVVLLTGDYITYNPNTPGEADFARQAAACAEALAPLQAAPRGVFAVMGNHDQTRNMFGTVRAALDRVGIHTLINQSVPLPGAEGVWLVGLGSRSVNAQNTDKALKSVPPGTTRLLLVHEPDYADESPAGFIFQVSGHSHAGQVRVPGLPPIYCPRYGRKYPEGLQVTQTHPVYTTRGVGMMGLQVRFCCPPEVTLLTLRQL